jgi:hypothetical protein
MSHELKLRAFLEYEGIPRKFFTLLVGRDNSFYVHLARPIGQPWRYPGTSAARENGMIELDFINFVEPSFDLRKISFHPTGYIHSTDAKGKRFRDGLRGPAFSDMTLPHEICAMCPSHPTTLPTFDQAGGNTLRIVIPNECGPFSAVLSIIETSMPPAASVPDVWPIIFPEVRFSLLLSLRPVREMVRKEPPPWPPFPFFVLMTGR